MAEPWLDRDDAALAEVIRRQLKLNLAVRSYLLVQRDHGFGYVADDDFAIGQSNLIDVCLGGNQ